ncbi:hypothetical protein Trco_004137 [Trichoderma cornu-damae]|uniref:Uncharacterized protein n=1 Tax=Trichoderma cornu-damae TaxID=654480 RepID=A0A9P8TXY7_9HYPO|nr:hypothetical protein Trco_004137 [Trichoderma cornu-damae]
MALRRWNSPAPLSSPLRIPQQKGADDTRGDADAADDGDAQEALLGDLVVDELAEVGGLEVGGFFVEEEVVVAAGLAVVAQLVVAEGEVVEAFAAALGGDAEDVGEEADAELLVVAVV